MKRLIAALMSATALTALTPVTSLAQDLPQAAARTSTGFDAFRPLIGQTWRGQAIHQDGVEDVMRWEWAVGGHAVRILHAVNGGVYGGETLIFPDKDSGDLIFHYFTTGGFHTTGVIRPRAEGGWTIEEHVQGADGVETLRSTAEIGADGVYRTRSQQVTDSGESEFGGFDYRPDVEARIALPWLEGAEPALETGGLTLSRRIVANPGEAGQDAAGYLRISDIGDGDQLLDAACACADAVEFHRIDRSGPQPDMVDDPVWDIPEGGRLEVMPGSALHLMLINFDPAKSETGRVTIDLTFRDAGVVRTDFALTPASRTAWDAFGAD